VAILDREMASPYIKHYMMTAGPTPLPPEVSQVMAEPILYHRAPAFVELYAHCLEGLKKVFQTENDVLCFAASGSGGMESAVANLAPAGPALVASCGKFGERWAELNEAFGAEFHHEQFEWGTRVEPDELDRVLGEHPGTKVVYVTLSETSTGVVNDIQALTEIVHKHDALIAVDAVSGLGAIPIPQDEWGVDVVAAGSQKALMCPPGLGFASPNQKAIDLAASVTNSAYYFDWQKTLKGQRKDPPDSPFTPAVSIFMALDVALGIIEKEGLENVFERHRQLGSASRAAVKALGLELFGPDDERANVVTAFKIPEGVDGGKVPKLLRDKYNITANGGQNQLKGKILRIAHTGYFGAFDIITSVAAVEMALADLGAEIETGAGVAAAQRVFQEAGVPAGATA
jgi:aspartate aminotransferase-like enzyme